MNTLRGSDPDAGCRKLLVHLTVTGLWREKRRARSQLPPSLALLVFTATLLGTWRLGT
jgi:hypothetical protein